MCVCQSACPCGYPTVVRPSIRPSGRPSVHLDVCVFVRLNVPVWMYCVLVRVDVCVLVRLDVCVNMSVCSCGCMGLSGCMYVCPCVSFFITFQLRFLNSQFSQYKSINPNL